MDFTLEQLIVVIEQHAYPFLPDLRWFVEQLAKFLKQQLVEFPNARISFAIDAGCIVQRCDICKAKVAVVIDDKDTTDDYLKRLIRDFRATHSKH